MEEIDYNRCGRQDLANEGGYPLPLAFQKDEHGE